MKDEQRQQYHHRSHHFNTSALPLQMLLSLDNVYFLPYWLTMIGLYIYKSVTLDLQYSSRSVYSIELGSLAALILVHPARIYLGSRGNKTESTAPLILFIVISCAMIFIHLFYALWQTFVFPVDVIINSIAICLIAAELLLGTWLTAQLQSTA